MNKSIGLRASLLSVFTLTTVGLSGQAPVEEFLNRVEAHSFYVEAGRAEADARIAETRSDNSPPDPAIEYGITRGIEDTKGNKIIYGISQNIAWPGEYAARSKYNSLEREQAETEFRAGRQDFLLRVKLLCYEIVHAQKRLEVLDRQQANAERALALTQKALDQGKATAIDLSRARLHVASSRAAWLKGSGDLAVKREQLALLAGIDDFDTAGFGYIERWDENPDDLLVQARDGDMRSRAARLESEKSMRNVSVVRGSTLPSFSVGITGERLSPEDSFIGPVIGVSIPLWGGSGRVRSAKARQAAAELRARTAQTDAEASLIELAARVRQLRESLAQYDSLKEVRHAIDLLDKSLKLENITAPEYFDKLLIFIAAEQNYLDLELEYYRALAELTRFRL